MKKLVLLVVVGVLLTGCVGPYTGYRYTPAQTCAGVPGCIHVHAEPPSEPAK